jgi:hypothetical protein
MRYACDNYDVCHICDHKFAVQNINRAQQGAVEN